MGHLGYLFLVLWDSILLCRSLYCEPVNHVHSDLVSYSISENRKHFFKFISNFKGRTYENKLPREHDMTSVCIKCFKRNRFLNIFSILFFVNSFLLWHPSWFSNLHKKYQLFNCPFNDHLWFNHVCSSEDSVY